MTSSRSDVQTPLAPDVRVPHETLAVDLEAGRPPVAPPPLTWDAIRAPALGAHRARRGDSLAGPGRRHQCCQHAGGQAVWGEPTVVRPLARKPPGDRLTPARGGRR